MKDLSLYCVAGVIGVWDSACSKLRLLCVCVCVRVCACVHTCTCMYVCVVVCLNCPWPVRCDHVCVLVSLWVYVGRSSVSMCVYA